MPTLIEGFECCRCGHVWRPRNIRIAPERCPKCNSPYWDKPRKTDGKA